MRHLNNKEAPDHWRAAGAPRRSSKDLSRIERSLSESAQLAPNFDVRRGRVRYRETPAAQAIGERKKLTLERCAELQKLCSLRSNEQPDLATLIDRYATALRSLTKSHGAYKLLVTGLEIETLLRIKERSPTDPDRNPPLSADLLFATQSLVIAHAGLISLTQMCRTPSWNLTGIDSNLKR